MSLSKNVPLWMSFSTRNLTIAYLIACAVKAVKWSSFNAFLEKDGTVLIQEKNIKILATETFKVSRNLAPPQTHEIFKLKDKPHYDITYNSPFSGPLVKSVYKRTESLSFLGPKIWDILHTYKDIPGINSCKVALKKWRPGNCPCRIFKVYITSIGFV